MKVLHIMGSRPEEVAFQILEAHAGMRDVKLIDLKNTGLTYDEIVKEIFSADKVISW